MAVAAYYNEIDPFAPAWLRELIKAGQITPGDVDERSIADVRADELRGYRQCHFFAGIGGWSYALRLAGWPDDRAVWTGSCPCQRFSSAARGRNVADDLWPIWRERIAVGLPCTVFGEQVVSAAWADRASADLEALGYAVGAAVLPALSVGQDHIRERFYFVGHANQEGEPGHAIYAKTSRVSRHHGQSRSMVQAHGVSRDVVAMSGFGNAIVPQVAAEFIGAYLEAIA